MVGGMTTIIAMRWAELGSIVSLLVLWSVLGALFVAILRRHAKDRRPPRGL